MMRVHEDISRTTRAGDHLTSITVAFVADAARRVTQAAFAWMK